MNRGDFVGNRIARITRRLRRVARLGRTIVVIPFAAVIVARIGRAVTARRWPAAARGRRSVMLVFGGIIRLVFRFCLFG